MIAIVDYGVGNLFSLSCSLRALGLEAEITADALSRDDDLGKLVNAAFSLPAPPMPAFPE